MELSVEQNQRVEWSRITDASILKRGDLLRLLGPTFQADIAVLDTHDPSADLKGVLPADEIEAGLARGDILPNHHHVLVKFPGSDDVVSTGMYVREGESDTLFFPHVTNRYQAHDAQFNRRLAELQPFLGSRTLGLFFISDDEQISRLPKAQPYVDDDGGLRR